MEKDWLTCMFGTSRVIFFPNHESHKNISFPEITCCTDWATVQVFFLLFVFFSSCIALWGLAKKKPLARRPHSLETEGEVEGGVGEGWVTSVAAYPNSDLVASGRRSTTL